MRMPAIVFSLILFSFSAFAQNISVSPPPTTAATAVNTRAPTTMDDSAHGYVVGSLWNFNNILYSAIDVTPGLAAWQVLTTNYPLPVDAVTDTTPFAAYGTHLLRAAYTGYAEQVERASDSTTLNVGFLSSGLENTQAKDAFCANTVCRVMIWYDQSGGAHNATAASFATAPAAVASSVIGNSRSIVFDTPGNISANGNSSETLTIPTGFGGNLANNAIIALNRTAINYGYTEPVQLNGSSFDMGFGYAASVMGVGITGSLFLTSNFPFALTPQVMGYNSSVTNVLMFNGVNSATYGSLSGLPSPLASGGYIGPAATGGIVGTNPNGFFETSSILIYQNLSNADISILQSSLNYTYGLTPQTQNNWVLAGDSITAGAQSSYLQTYERKAERLLNQPYTIYNYGSYGNTLQALSSIVSSFYSGVYSSSARNNIMTVALGTNDIANTSGLTASQLYGYLTTFCANAHAVGWKVVVATVLPAIGYTTAQQTVWNAYNGLVRTNWTSIADGLADIQASDVMGPFSATSNTSLYPDGVHPSDLGYTYIAPIFASAVNALTK